MVAVIVQVATPPLRVPVEAHEVTPEGVETLQVTVPVGVAPGPETVAKKVIVLPSFVGEEFVTLLVGVLLPMVTESVLLPAEL